MAETARVATAASAASVFLMALPFQEPDLTKLISSRQDGRNGTTEKALLSMQSSTFRLNDQ
jgi:hypothetical protein